MNAWILRRLRSEARRWWYHAKLREAGQAVEAARRERASIRSDLGTIRKGLAADGAFVSTGIGGTTVHYGRGCTLSSHGTPSQMATAEVLVALGLPFVDTRPVQEKLRLIELPLVAVGQKADPAPWGALSYAPLGEYAARARALGAVVRNIEPQPDGASTA